MYHVPKILPLPLINAKNGDKHVVFEGVGEDVLFFFCHFPLFPSSSQSVLKRVPQYVPNRTLIISHMVCPRLFKCACAIGPNVNSLLN